MPEVDVVSEGVVKPATIKEKYQLPQTSESVTAERLRETVNVVDTEDAVKYFPEACSCASATTATIQAGAGDAHMGREFERAQPRLCG